MVVSAILVVLIYHPAIAIGDDSDIPSRPPNIILIIGDDQAFGDFGFMGNKEIKTPHLDRLAEQSARFPNAYVPTSLCRPSLATLLTGLFPHQHGIFFNDPPNKERRQEAERLIRATPTLPRILGQAGYRTFQTGKLWEGSFANAGFSAGMTHGDPAQRKRHPTLGMLSGRHGDIGLEIGRDGLEPIYRFIDEAPQKPFFIWYAPMMPHTPHNPPEKYRELYLDKGLHPFLVNYYAMCSWFDATVGELLAAIDQRGLADDTLVAFVVDNGWITDTTGQRPEFAPRSKRSPYEGGIRTPMLFRWPKRIQPRTFTQLASSTDIVPTLLSAAGVSENLPKFAGLDLLPLVQGTGSIERDAVFGEIYNHDGATLDDPARDLLYRWVRRGRWKLIDAVAPAEPDLLFDLERDPGEQHNLANDPVHAAELANLRRRLDEWWPGKPTAQ